MNSEQELLYVADARILLLKGDITKQDTDAIVNAANSTLLGGGGVDGAIHRAGGPAILEECKKLVEKIGRCPAGEAVITGAGHLAADYVIHTVGPVWSGGQRGESELLSNSYRNSYRLAVENNLSSISFPSISTGAYGYPVAAAAEISLRTIFSAVRGGGGVTEVRFVLFSDGDLAIYRETAPRVRDDVLNG
jgi:O-acetyl-ADP-ribose deacetylase (regulator of RNase III)